MLKNVIKFFYYDFPRILLNGRVFPCRNLVIELTYRCNLSCKMCSIQNEIAIRKDLGKKVELDQDEILGILDQMPLKSNITFTGGETLIKTGIDAIIRNAAERHRVTIGTNGLLLENYAAMIVESGVKAVGTSLDGPPEIHDSIRNKRQCFNELQKGIEALLKVRDKNGSKFPLINVNCVILPENYESLTEVVKQVRTLGLNSCSFQIFDASLIRSGMALQKKINVNESPVGSVERINPTCLKKSLHQTLEESKKQHVKIAFSPPLTIDEIVNYYQKVFDLTRWRCHLPWNTMRISPYGDVYPCLNYSIGNIRENNLQKLWNNDRYFQFRHLLKNHAIFQACIGCCKMFPIKFH